MGCAFSFSKRLAVMLALMSLLFSLSSFADDFPQRPKIGLALSGGGAKGAAHVGVLKALEEMHIPVDYIAGTSMGAYVGGLYASGMTADDIEVLIESIEWTEGYQDRAERGMRRVNTKASDDKYNLRVNIGFDGTEIKTPQGIVQGQYMKRILRESTGSLPEFTSFDELVLPFRAVATDIENLTPVILDRGILSKAMFASMAIPGVLPAANVDGTLLVDGGPVNNMPVDVLKDMGADIVIAVDIGTDYAKADKLKSFYQVTNQLINYMVRSSTEAQIANMSLKDVLLTPDIGDMETADFERMPEALQKGYQITLLSDATLSPLVVSSAEYQAYVERKQQRRKQLVYADQVEVAKVTISNNSPYSEHLLKEKLGIESGKIDTRDLEAAIENLNALDRFESIEYDLHQTDEGNELHLEVRERSWGPNFVDFRFSIEDDFNDNAFYTTGLRIINTGLSEYGAELSTELEMGNNRAVGVGLFVPLGPSQKFTSRFWGKYSATQATEFFQPGDEPSLDSDDIYKDTFVIERKEQWSMGGELSWQPTLWSELSIGYEYRVGELNQLNLFKRNFSRERPYVRYTMDTLDDRVFPSKGSYLSAMYSWVSDSLTAEAILGPTDIKSKQLDVELLHAASYDKHTLSGKLTYSGTANILDVTEVSAFGSYKQTNLLIEPRELGGFSIYRDCPEVA
ncbi:patatin-like phospholipase family protein [Veronia nyctiphanis]|uniref:patatin-like phospholipase family protein n=1 Tax=Veronia nyctiphanis TaxID=1278244 RepID=UPI001F1B6836|nr:patatin-like phospholipase family protein [Veronia nyctiphanis]